MSKNEKITIKLKYSKIKNFEKICFYFSNDYTAKETADKTNISRQTINNYYQILRDKTNEEFLNFDDEILEKLLKSENLYIRYLNIYQTNIFYLQYKDFVLILDESMLSKSKLKNFIRTKIQEPLSKHKRANCARILLSQDKQSFFLSVLLKKEDRLFEDFLLARLKKFRGINKEKLFDYIKESQIRYNSSSNIIYQKLLLNFSKI